jgi:hypothetical protein
MRPSSPQFASLAKRFDLRSHARRSGQEKGDRVRGMRDWIRQQFTTKNRRVAFTLALVAAGIAVAAVHVSAWWFSPGVMILPILAGGYLLWPRALRVLFAVVTAGLIYDVVQGKAGVGIVLTIVVTAIFADVLSHTRGKLGIRGRRAEQMLIDLRDRIKVQGTLPDLGDGWGGAVVLRPAGG